MRRAALPAVLLVAALAACSGGGGGSAFGESLVEADAGSAPPCAEMFAPGRPVADVVADMGDMGGPCLNAGEVIYLVAASWPCPDGTTVHDVGAEYGWGRDGGTWNGPDVPRPDLGCT